MAKLVPSWLGTASTKDVPASGTNAASTQAVMGDDTRLSDARTPTAHAASHASAGADPITPASIGAATAAQGSKADTAVQVGSLAAVATTGAYADLTGKPSVPDPTTGTDGQAWVTNGSTGSWQDVAARDTLYTASVSGSVAIDYENGPVQELTLTGATTFTIATPSLSGVAAVLTLSVIQDATGGRTVTWPSSVKWSQGFAPAFSTTAGDESVVTLVWSSSRGWRGFVSGVAMQVAS